jgi:hypothetical protein
LQEFTLWETIKGAWVRQKSTGKSFVTLLEVTKVKWFLGGNANKPFFSGVFVKYLFFVG